MLFILIVFLLAAGFIIAERLLPGRELPHVPGWYGRAAFLNACQLGVVVLAGKTWNRWFAEWSLVSTADLMPAWALGLLAWFIGTFIFYWWHRLRHWSDLCWLVLHQIHHSPARIETLTAFYKHPLEIAINAAMSSAIVYLALGGGVEAAGWYNIFAAGGEMFYHSNLRTPRWLGWFIQRPEHHSIHHELGVHAYNYGDITWWDRLFGTFREADEFRPACGFAKARETRLGPMLVFRNAADLT